jgi:hypothetical protein
VYKKTKKARDYFKNVAKLFEENDCYDLAAVFMYARDQILKEMFWKSSFKVASILEISLNEFLEPFETFN